MENPPPDRAAERLVAAYDVGRLLSRLIFHAEQAALDLDRHAEEPSEAFSRLIRWGRIFRPVAERAKWQKEIRDEFGGYFEKYGGLRNSQDYCEAAHKLWYEVNSPDGPRPEEALEDFVSGHRAMVKILRRRLIEGFDRRETLAEQLGELVEQGIRPGDIHEKCYAYVKRPARDGRSAPRRRWIGPVSREPGEVPPPETWEEDLKEFARELDLPSGLVTEALGPASSGAGRDYAAIVERLDAAIRAELSGGSRGKADPTLYLGLILDRDRDCLRREGYPEPVPVGGELNANLLGEFIKNRDCFTGTRRLREIWEESGLQDNPVDSTIRDRISDLKGLIEDLDVTFEVKKGFGRRLVDARGATGRPSAGGG